MLLTREKNTEFKEKHLWQGKGKFHALGSTIDILDEPEDKVKMHYSSINKKKER